MYSYHIIDFGAPSHHHLTKLVTIFLYIELLTGYWRPPSLSLRSLSIGIWGGGGGAPKSYER